MITEAISLDVAQYTTQYELLRSQVSGTPGHVHAGAPRGVGLALLLRDGVPGWLKTVASVIRASQRLSTAEPEQLSSSKPATAGKSLPPWLADVARRDLTTLLASLVLSTRSPREGYPSCP